MRVQILSDLHLEVERPGYPEGCEFYNYEIPVQAEYLALLGDIGCTVHDQLFDWLRTQLKRFKMLFYVMGNHGA
jgi:UDP-2,3-diacylglucosamine pyrophosphatase LpxH